MNNIKRKISISFIIYMFIAVLCGCRDNQYDVNANEGVQLKEIIIGSDSRLLIMWILMVIQQV